MADTVIIEGLKVAATIGVYEWEQQIKQQLVIDLYLDWDCAAAGATDALADALDYAAVSDAVTALVSREPRQLIERVATEICTLVLTQFAVTQVTVKVAKPGAVPTAQSVAVQLTRSRAVTTS